MTDPTAVLARLDEIRQRKHKVSTPTLQGMRDACRDNIEDAAKGDLPLHAEQVDHERLLLWLTEEVLAARSDIPALLAAITHLQAERERLVAKVTRLEGSLYHPGGEMGARGELSLVTDKIDDLCEAKGQGCADDHGGPIDAMKHMLRYLENEEAEWVKVESARDEANKARDALLSANGALVDGAADDAVEITALRADIKAARDGYERILNDRNALMVELAAARSQAARREEEVRREALEEAAKELDERAVDCRGGYNMHDDIRELRAAAGHLRVMARTKPDRDLNGPCIGPPCIVDRPHRYHECQVALAAPPAARMLIADRHGFNHDPREVAEFLDGMGDRADEATGESLHDAADVMRGLLNSMLSVGQLVEGLRRPHDARCPRAQSTRWECTCGASVQHARVDAVLAVLARYVQSLAGAPTAGGKEPTNG